MLNKMSNERRDYYKIDFSVDSETRDIIAVFCKYILLQFSGLRRIPQREPMG